MKMNKLKKMMNWGQNKSLLCTEHYYYPLFWCTILTEANLMQYILLCSWIKNKSLLSIKHNYYSLFWHMKSYK
jgi:hypothetical protein